MFVGGHLGRLVQVERLVSVDPRPTYHGWVWLVGYVLDDKGLAVDKREVYVRRAGLEVLGTPSRAPARSGETRATGP
ncbi:hypothetical protein ABZS77_23035 [Micromonospora sp. NPDC005298]|uniref:hypothetical protein n=1 Tax=Micromonospora sp. NPDC005298 TaxID=3156873 RepID=UPI0033AB7B8E